MWIFCRSGGRAAIARGDRRPNRLFPGLISQCVERPAMPNRLSASTSRLALTSVGVGILVLALKFWAWGLTGSVALWSDALESFVNVATAIAALVAIRYSAKPADADHPFGHGKAEYFSVVLEGVLIIIAAISILSSAWSGFQHPRASNSRRWAWPSISRRRRSTASGRRCWSTSGAGGARWRWPPTASTCSPTSPPRSASSSACAGGCHRLARARSAAGGGGGGQHPVAGLEADSRLGRRADGRGGVAGDPRTHPHHHLGPTPRAPSRRTTCARAMPAT